MAGLDPAISLRFEITGSSPVMTTIGDRIQWIPL
jgi:hypothetical protein